MGRVVSAEPIDLSPLEAVLELGLSMGCVYRLMSNRGLRTVHGRIIVGVARARREVA